MTPRQKQLHSYMMGYQKKNGYAPTFREMAAHLGTYVSTPHMLVRYLQKQGAAEKKDYHERSWWAK